MAGKRLLDAALVLNATRAIARQHINIRSQQLEVWSQTSSLGKALKNQTDRVVLTARAANALAQRLSESSPSTYNVQTKASPENQDIPRHQTVNETSKDTSLREGLGQDHHYERSAKNATEEPAKHEDLTVQQEQAARHPTPDGTIPQRGAPVETDVRDISAPETESTRVSQAPAKAPLAHDQNQELKPASSRKPNITDPTADQKVQIPRHEAVPEQEELPEGINTDVFHSPRIAELLGGKSKKGQAKGDLSLKGAKRTPIDHTGLHESKDQDTFNVRKSGSSTPAKPDVEAKDDVSTTKISTSSTEDMQSLAADLAHDSQISAQMSDVTATTDSSTSAYHMRESRVPSSRFGRLWQYGGLATSMAFGAVGETFRRATGSGSGGSLMLSPANMARLVAKLSRMRGAALKLGQMMSFQDSRMLPAPIAQVLQRVQDNADYMPASQRDQVLSSNLGPDWRSLFDTFDDVPLAAASIGQVHRATLAADSREVAVKIQYPGVATSISSDLNNLSILLNASRLLPKGLYLDKTIANARTELAWECDYEREAECQTRFGALLADSTDTFTVPSVITAASGPQVLTTDLMHGLGVTKPALRLTQPERDWIGTRILALCLRELADFRFMQTDPNWTNFLYNRATRRLELLDFGAARDFPRRFTDPYMRVLVAAAADPPDRDAIVRLSVQLGYLTGHEGRAMRDAHVDSVCTLAEPFRAVSASAASGDASKNEAVTADGLYDFRVQTVTDRVRAFIPVMVRERLAPPPEETYSLHRKLSGAFLLLAKLGSRVDCREMFVSAVEKWEKEAGRE